MGGEVHDDWSLSGATLRKEAKLITPRQAYPAARVSQVWRLCRHRLVVMGAATSGWYELYEGDALLATFTPKQLADGIDPTTVKELSTNKRAAALMKLGEERQRLLGLA